jgi:glycosyltransferase involved in cell wall biosynthesis
MKLIGLMRVRNEARWIERTAGALVRECDAVVVLDDHSDDGTPEIARAVGATVLPSPFRGIDEARDKDYLLKEAERVIAARGGGEWWAVMMDGDEELEHGGGEIIRAAVDSGRATAYTVQIMYLWNDTETLRVDGIYGRFHRPSVFRMREGLRFRRTGRPGNLHCGSVPLEAIARIRPSGARAWHYGYMLREDRLRKWQYYTRFDPRNYAEDCYRHIVQGDVPDVPAEAKLKHAGPLRLVRLSEAQDASGSAA